MKILIIENDKYKYELTVDKSDLNYCIDILIQLGEIINRMLKLKLYLSYCLIILGIIKETTTPRKDTTKAIILNAER